VSKHDDTEMIPSGAAKAHALTDHDLFHTPVGDMTQQERLGAGVILKALEDSVKKRFKEVKVAVQEDAELEPDNTFEFKGVGKVKVVGGRTARNLDVAEVKTLLKERGIDVAVLDDDRFWKGGVSYKQVRMTGSPVLLAKLEGL